MKLITWNVNSIKMRFDRLRALLERHEPDIVCLQETKSVDEKFPFLELKALGYHAATWGQQAYNGVAILSRAAPNQVVQSFPHNPAPEQARLIRADIGGITVISAYVVNGKAVGSEPYELKLTWLDTLKRWLVAEFDREQPLILAGDFNITPSDEDTYNADVWRGKILCSEPERNRLHALLDWGLTDLHAHHQNEADRTRFTWWDYRYGAFHRDLGLRIDLILATAPLAARCTVVSVDREERKEKSGPGKPSDHAPVVAEFAD